MKITKTFTIDVENMQKLEKEENASGLVNRLLNAHYKKDILDGLSLGELKELERLTKIQEDIDKKEKEILYKNK